MFEMFAKIDVKSAFWQLLVHPADCHLLAMKWKKTLFIDTCLPVGLRSALKLFNILADLLSWILEHQHVSLVMPYLDDFLTTGPHDSSMCANNLQMIKDTCSRRGFLLPLRRSRACPSA